MSQPASWPAMSHFADWLSMTPMSVYLQRNEVWAIPSIQSVHIVGIGVILGSALMITLRVMGWAGMDQTPLENQKRFGPWLLGAFAVLLVTGLLMAIAEPTRDLVNFSFWLKMALVLLMTVLAALFEMNFRGHDTGWAERLFANRPFRVAALATFVIWAAIIFLGRFIAYDHVWGHLSPATKA